jgi:hypothetical protein
MTTTLERPAESAGALYRRTDISPADFFQALGRVRRTVRDEIERLIAVDDRGCDEDTDLEASLGSFDRMSDQVKAWRTTTGYGSAYDVDCELDRCDAEPSLGSVNTHHNHERWAEGNADDREGDPGCDDREPEVDHEDGDDDEPAFGWSEEEAAKGRYPSLMGHRAEFEGE